MKQVLCLLIIAGAAGLHAADRPEAKPNIVYILADDLGGGAESYRMSSGISRLDSIRIRSEQQ